MRDFLFGLVASLPMNIVLWILDAPWWAVLVNALSLGVVAGYYRTWASVKK